MNSLTSIRMRSTPDAATAAKEYLGFNRGVFKISNEATLLEKEKTEEEFIKFYKIVLETNSVDAVKAMPVDYTLDHIHLLNRMDLKDYDTKTKLRALFVSVMIQRIITLRAQEMGEEAFIASADAELVNLWPRIDEFTGPDRRSLRDFYLVLREAKFWQIQKKWEKFAFRTTSLGVNEGIWYCPGGGATIPTRNRLELFKVFENIPTEPKTEEQQQSITAKKPRSKPITGESGKKRSRADGETGNGLKGTSTKPREKKQATVETAAAILTAVSSSGVNAPTVSVDHDSDSEASAEGYDEDEDKQWCIDIAGKPESVARDGEGIAQYVVQHEERDHPSYTRVNFDSEVFMHPQNSTESFLRSYIQFLGRQKQG